MMKKRLLLLALAAGLSLPSAAVDLAAEQLPPERETGVINSRYLLMDANGRAVSNQDFRGRFQLLTFGYTYCPDVCPTTLAEMAMVINRLGKNAEALQALFITVDPERDTADTLRSYVAFFDPRIIALTGSPALVRKAADNFKVRYEKVREPDAPPDQYAVDHSAGMVLLGPDGRFIRKFAYAMPAAQIAEHILDMMASNGLRQAPASK
ncbi:SCO family protein [Candidatus Accumulibacter sp. ACC007]|uniref:SCO family protein n=1 Tax=Candidatus Accumulibacter sp. ACC007 TaxID=2823333 RepID=UPI0025C182BC|nr:SCO family protein [Candidatus Accumulibacter sp. ACC007]